MSLELPEWLELELERLAVEFGTTVEAIKLEASGEFYIVWTGPQSLELGNLTRGWSSEALLDERPADAEAWLTKTTEVAWTACAARAAGAAGARVPPR